MTSDHLWRRSSVESLWQLDLGEQADLRRAVDVLIIVADCSAIQTRLIDRCDSSQMAEHLLGRAKLRLSRDEQRTSIRDRGFQGTRPAELNLGRLERILKLVLYSEFLFHNTVVGHLRKLGRSLARLALPDEWIDRRMVNIVASMKLASFSHQDTCVEKGCFPIDNRENPKRK